MKFCVKLGKFATERFEIHGEVLIDPMTRTLCFEGHSHIRNSRMFLKDDDKFKSTTEKPISTRFVSKDHVKTVFVDNIR